MTFTVDVIELRKDMAEQEITTIGQLAALSGVDRNTVSKVLNGRIRPSTTVMEKLAIALKMQPSRAGLIFFKPNLRDS